MTNLSIRNSVFRLLSLRELILSLDSIARNDGQIDLSVDEGVDYAADFAVDLAAHESVYSDAPMMISALDLLRNLERGLIDDLLAEQKYLRQHEHDKEY